MTQPTVADMQVVMDSDPVVALKVKCIMLMRLLEEKDAYIATLEAERKQEVGKTT